MSLIRRRKSPGWEKIPVKRTVIKVSKSVTHKKTIKIVNPISGKKINLNGPTHKRLIREKVLDIKGIDIRSKKTKPKPKLKPKAQKPKPRLYGDVMGNIMRFMPEKQMVKVSKYKEEYSEQNLLSYPFDLSDAETCQAFSDSDFDALMKNQSLDRQALFNCVVRRGMVDKVKILLKKLLEDEKVDHRYKIGAAIILASRGGHFKTVKLLLKHLKIRCKNSKCVSEIELVSVIPSRGDEGSAIVTKCTVCNQISKLS